MSSLLNQAEQYLGNMDQDKLQPLEKTMVRLFHASIAAGRVGNYSCAAAVLNSQDEILSIGVNGSFHPYPSSISHAEQNALNEYEKKRSQEKDVYLITTLAPCLMCTARILLSNVKKVLYLMDDPAGGGIQCVKGFPLNYRELAKRTAFQKMTLSQSIYEVGKLLYEAGEEIWNQQLNL